MFVIHLLNVTLTISLFIQSSMHTCVVFAVHDGEVSCLGVDVFDSHIQLMDKSSLL